MNEKQIQPEGEEAIVVQDANGKEDAEAKEKEFSGGKAYLRIFTFADRPAVILLFIGFLAAIASGAALALVNVVFGRFVNIVNEFSTGVSTPAQFRSDVGGFALYFIYLFIARFGLAYIYTTTVTFAATRITRSIRFEFLKASLSQEIAFFDSGRNSAISVQVTTNGNLIQLGIAEKLGLSIQAISAFVSAFIVSFTAQWKLTLITSVIAPSIILVTGSMAGIDAKLENRMLSIYGRAAALAEDVISSMRTVHAFWARPRLVRKYDTYLEDAHTIGRKKSLVYGILFSTEFFLVYSGFALAFWRGVHMYASGEISDPGKIVTVIFSVVVAATSLTQLAPNILTFTNAASAAGDLFKTIDRKSSINPLDAQGQQPASVAGDIELSGVNFSYPTRAQVRVLHDFTLKVPPGKVTALVGASGSGKSTIVALLERWYNPESGKIKLDGIPIEDLNLRWLRTKVRLVQQEPVLFNGTVFQNVRNGLVGTEWEDAPEEKQMAMVEDACKQAYAHDFVTELPQGYHTEVGERAGLLSGGQKQRIAIARSIISNPTVLLLDEATSALDPHAEGIVQQALDKASRNRTTIVIAHKLATIKNADNIVVMSKGRIVEQGTHESLVAAKSIYYTLVGLQDLGKQHGEPMEARSEDSDTRSLKLGRTLTPYATREQKRLESENAKNDYSQHKQRGFTRIIATFLGEQKGLWVYYAIAFSACILGGGTYPAQAILFSRIMEVFLLEGPALTDRGDFYSLMFFVVALGNLTVYFILGITSNIIFQTMTHRYRREMFECVLRQDMQFFDRPENTVGAVTSKLSTQPTQLQELLGFNLSLILIILTSLVSSSALGLAYGWKLGLVVVLGGLPPMVGAGYLRVRLELAMGNRNTKLFGDSAAFAAEAISAIRTVSSLALERKVLEKYQEALDHILRQSVPSVLHSMFWYAFTQSVEFAILALGFWYGCRLVSYGEYTMQQFYIVFLGVFFSGQAASQFFSYTSSISKAKEAANYIMWLRNLKPVMAETDQNRDQGPKPEDPSLDLDDVRFTYPMRPDAQVLRGIDIDIRPGQFIAFVGASGCGKSTMIAMLERFYDPTSGRILLNSDNIAAMSPKLYRQGISLVQQEPTLYQGSIRENITLGLATDEDTVADDVVIDACNQANAYEFISSLPEGLSTPCGTRGLSLSGGQRQRIAIARALIRSPRILLLDEATSALDSESEKIVQAALGEAAARGDRITIAVAHRLSTIKDAAAIFVFMGGKIVEAGTHTELIDRRSLYFKMCEAQSLDRQV